jgi:hypothetical protein
MNLLAHTLSIMLFGAAPSPSLIDLPPPPAAKDYATGDMVSLQRETPCGDQEICIRKVRYKMIGAAQCQQNCWQVVTDNFERKPSTIAAAVVAAGNSTMTSGDAIDQIRARFLEDFSRGASIKVAMVESAYTNGKWPSTMSEMGYPESGNIDGHMLKSARVNGNVLILKFEPLEGFAGGTVALVGVGNLETGTGIRWDCASADIPAIKRLVPGCAYTGPAR